MHEPADDQQCRNGPPGMLTPEDLIIAFSDGIDHDGNGYVNDIAGWNYVDNNNDPYDDVHYGHGTGEEKDSAAEADNGIDDAGTLPELRDHGASGGRVVRRRRQPFRGGGRSTRPTAAST